MIVCDLVVAAVIGVSRQHRVGRDRPVGAVCLRDQAALPHARIAVDHWHLVRLANEMVTEVANASPVTEPEAVPLLQK